MDSAFQDFPLSPEDSKKWSYWDGNQYVENERPPKLTEEGIFY